MRTKTQFVHDVNSRPHGVGDAHRCAQEGREAEEGDEEGGHLTRPPCLSGSLTVHHQTRLHEREKERVILKQ